MDHFDKDDFINVISEYSIYPKQFKMIPYYGSYLQKMENQKRPVHNTRKVGIRY
jgi:hypothetical protein